MALEDDIRSIVGGVGQADQALEGARTVARMTRAFYQELIEQGFGEVKAFQLTVLMLQGVISNQKQ